MMRVTALRRLATTARAAQSQGGAPGAGLGGIVKAWPVVAERRGRDLGEYLQGDYLQHIKRLKAVSPHGVRPASQISSPQPSHQAHARPTMSLSSSTPRGV